MSNQHEWSPANRQAALQSYLRDGLNMADAKKATLALERRMMRRIGRPNYYRVMIAADIGMATPREPSPE